MDQIVSAQPGLVPQMSGNLTSSRITGATVFVDHVSHYTYVHLMHELLGDACHNRGQGRMREGF